jgi:hypothetical protein
MRLRVFLEAGVFVGCLAFAACNAETPPTRDEAPAEEHSTVADPEVPRAQQRLDSLATAINAAVGEAHAEDASQCRTIAYGAKPCGGPWRYLVYSTAATDSTRLARVVDEYNDTQDYLNRKLGLSSDCALVAEPTTALEDGRCVVAGGADG